MTPTTAMVWKEWRESRLFLWIGWGLLLGLPVVGMVEERLAGQRPDFVAAPLVLFTMPVLAVLVAIYCTTRDLQPKLADFWRSRPITPLRLFGMKYAVNAGVVLLAGGVPLLLELLIGGHQELFPIGPYDLWQALFWLAIFSTAFAVGIVVQRAAHAAAVGVVALLLILSVPVIFPPLAALHIGQLDNGPHARLGFIGGMLSLCALAPALAALALRRQWKIESTRPLLYTAIAAAFLMLIASASYQLGTSLPVLAQQAIPRQGQVCQFDQDGNRLFAFCQTPMSFEQGGGPLAAVNWTSQRIQFNGDQLHLGPVNQLPLSPWEFQARSDEDPSVYYAARALDSGEVNNTTLHVTRIDSPPASPLPPVPLWTVPILQNRGVHLYVANHRLFVLGTRNLIFDISDPLHPKPSSDSPALLASGSFNWGFDPVEVVTLPSLPGVSAQKKLQLWMGRFPFMPSYAFDGSTWIRSSNNLLAIYRLQSLTDTTATFQRVSIYRPTLVQQIVGQNYYSTVALHGNLLYAVTDFRGVNVFDLAGPRPLRLIAHFVAPSGVQTCLPLPGGRCLVGGDHLWLLGPPPHTGSTPG